MRGCGSFVLIPTLKSRTVETVWLPEDTAGFTPAFAADVLGKIRGLSENSGSTLKFAFRTLAGEERALFLLFERSSRRKTAYPVLRSEGLKPLFIRHNGTADLHDVEFEFPDEGTLKRWKDKAKRFWESFKKHTHQEDSFLLAIKAIAVAVGVWLVATVGSAVLAGIAFFASYAVVLALIAASAVVVARLFRGFDSRPARTDRATYTYVERSKKFSDIDRTVAA